MVTEIKDANFASFIQSRNLVLVDFSAAWCPPCRRLAPILKEISSELEGTLAVAEIDVDENPESVTEYGVMSMPTLILIEHGKPVKTLVGYRPKEDLLKEFNIQ